MYMYSNSDRACRFFFLIVVSLLLTAGTVAAQSLVAESKMTSDAFVLHEPLTMSISLANQGVSPYIVDDYGTHRDNSITVQLKSQEDGFLAPQNEYPFGDVMVMPNSRETIEADLMQVFPVYKPGRYFAQAIIRRGDEAVATRLLMFDIVNGIEITALSRPLADYDNLSRKYTLLYWPRDRHEVLFLRIDENPPGECVGLLQLGNVVRFADPLMEFSEDGRTLTVQHQSSRDLYVRTTLKTDRSGIEILDRQQLLNPNITPMSRAILQERAQQQSEDTGLEGGVFRRRRPSTVLRRRK